ncbi:MAG: protease inhibitor I42 family protein [Clostridia bacterium]
MKKGFITIMAILLAIGCMGCAAQQKQLTIKLDGNISTGYGWYGSFSEEGIAKIASDEYIDGNKNGMVGGGGVFEFTIEGIAAGETKLTFIYMREWEGEQSAVDMRVYTLKVDEKGGIEVLDERQGLPQSDINIVDEVDDKSLAIELPEDTESGYEWITIANNGGGTVNYLELHEQDENGNDKAVYYLNGEQQGKMVIEFYYVPEGGKAEDASGSAIYTVNIAADGRVTVANEKLNLPQF